MLSDWRDWLGERDGQHIRAIQLCLLGGCVPADTVV